MLLYSGFATLVNDRRPFFILFGVWATVFVGRMYEKESSLMKKEGYAK